MNRKKAILTVAVSAALCYAAPGLYNALNVRYFSVESEKLNGHVRIALITDLHSCKYGKNEQQLLDRIDEQYPDVIMMCGDIFDHRLPDENAEAFLAGVSKKYPCYYVTGNHEYRSEEEAFGRKMEILEKYGVTRLSGKGVTAEINGTKINVCGVDDPLSLDFPFENTLTVGQQLENMKDIRENGNFTVMLSHRPELISAFADFGCDLVLSGHAHGGQWKFPGILDGVIATGQGLFPKYVGGEYNERNTKMIVSRGLARETTLVPRFYNRPEIVIIDLH